jgi:hypothetical protein
VLQFPTCAQREQDDHGATMKTKGNSSGKNLEHEKGKMSPGKSVGTNRELARWALHKNEYEFCKQKNNPAIGHAGNAGSHGLVRQKKDENTSLSPSNTWIPSQSWFQGPVA